MTTVGYGDHFPTTIIGRAMAILLMIIGVGIFGVMTSYMASVFLAPREGDPKQEAETLEKEISEMKTELARIGETLNRMEGKLEDINPET